MAEVKQRWEFTELVDRIRNGPARFSVFAIPGVDEGANTTEFFIHHEDVRRAGDAPADRRANSGDDVEEWMWRRLKLLARAWFRRAQVGVVLERWARPGRRREPETIRAVAGSPIVTLVGRPSELMIFAHGRRTVAEVSSSASPRPSTILNATDLRV